MKYLKPFNEKFGINKDLDDQCRNFFKKVQENPQENNFNFILKNEKGEYPFELKVGTFDGGTHGRFNLILNDDKSIKKTLIYLKNRNDYSTFLHELKHLDYATRKRNFYKDVFHVAKDKLSELRNHPLVLAHEIFYLLDKNEFESRYHGYYVDFDNFISKNISKNPTPGEIYSLFERFLIHVTNSDKDLSWTWYVNDREFKFENFFKKDDLNSLFRIISKTDFYKDEYKNVFRYIKSIIKRAFKLTFKIYTKEELLDIERTKKMYETQINKRLPNYRKKFFKLVPLMVDKWVNN